MKIMRGMVPKEVCIDFINWIIGPYQLPLFVRKRNLIKHTPWLHFLAEIGSIVPTLEDSFAELFFFLLKNFVEDMDEVIFESM